MKPKRHKGGDISASPLTIDKWACQGAGRLAYAASLMARYSLDILGFGQFDFDTKLTGRSWIAIEIQDVEIKTDGVIKRER